MNVMLPIVLQPWFRGVTYTEARQGQRAPTHGLQSIKCNYQLQTKTATSFNKASSFRKSKPSPGFNASAARPQLKLSSNALFCLFP